MSVFEARASTWAWAIAAVGAASFAAPQVVLAQTVVNMMQAETPRSMDPGDHSATQTASVLGSMYEGLVGYNKTLEREPKLATSWTTSADGLVWTFTLRQGVKFHDGTPFNAAAVVSSFQRLLDPKRGLAGGGRFRPVIGAVEATDPTTVKFTLKAPYPALLGLLSINQAAIVSPEADKAGTLGSKPVGTGPFKINRYQTGEYVLLDRNPDYWGQKGKVDQLRFSWSSEQAVLNMSVQAGEADVVAPLPPVFAGPLKNNRDVTVLQSDSSRIFWVALNVKLKPLDDVRVRQALNYATDRTGLVGALLQGFGKPANSPLAPVVFGYDAKLAGYPYDVAKAKALLTEAGYPDGIKISVAVQQQESNIAEVLQGMWAKAGITLDVRRMETGVWSASAFGDPARKASENLNSVIASWSSATLDADIQLKPVYATASWAPGNANLGFYSNPRVDQILDEAGSSGDQGKRATLYQEAQKIISDEAAHVLLYYPVDLMAVRKDISGVWTVPGGQVVASDVEKK